MADMLTIGSTAANTFKTALDVTSHNVANVSTDGYSRQRAEISSNTPNIVGTAFLGGGSAVDLIQRIQADYVQTQLYTTNSGVERFSNQLQMSTQVEGIVASNDEGIQEFLQRFYDSLQNLADNPTSSTSRQLVLDEAGNLESHINNLSTILNDTQQQVNTQIEDLTNEVNTRLEVVQTINNQVSRALASGTQPPNDLLDQRDQAILELSSYVDIKTYPQQDGRIDIHTANGRLPLLSDNTLTRLEAGLGEYRDENRTEVYMSIGDQREIITDYLTGGALGGVIDFRSNMLDKTQNDLGVTLNALTASTNWQHYQGWDLNGEAGQEFFAPLNTNVIGHVDNKGTEDGSSFIVSFRPYFDPAIYPTANGIYRGQGENPPYDSDNIGTTASDQPVDMAAKEGFLKGALDSIGNMRPEEYEITAIDTNGDGTVDGFNMRIRGEKEFLTFEQETVIGVDPNLLEPRFATSQGITFELDPAVLANIEVGDQYLVQPHKDILADFEKVIEDPTAIAARGQSQLDTDGDGDLGNEVPAPAAYGDNVNMANMASLYNKKLMFSDGGGTATETIMGGYSTMATNVGMYVRGSDIQLTAQENVHQQILMQRESISGVSLDEEAANLMRYQQAYEAAAQIIATSQSIFQTLLGAVRG
ncbi:MAG: flagellar hook-associated protein FlgK [Thiotrichales bacterium]|nr:flagellar hook-associated protein FlgK [Thiotrichales bacterium]